MGSDLDGGSTDNCGSVSLTPSKNSFTCADIGVNSVVVTVMDGNLNMKTCSTTVTVQDTVSPQAVCQNITVYLDGSGNATITTGDLDNGSNDNCGHITYSTSQTSFSCADLGHNNVTLTVTDNHMNSSSCVSSVMVVDTTSPVAKCKNITINLNPDGTVEITPEMIDNGSYDNCSIQSMEVNIPTLTCDDIGDNVIILTVTDQSGNTNTCSATVTLNEILISTSPSIAGMSSICPGLNGVPYSVNTDPNVKVYNWSYSGTGATIHNNGQPNITVDFSLNATSGFLSVEYSNTCGSTDLS